MKQDRNGVTRITATTSHALPDAALQRQIAERAYQLFELRGGSHGSDMQDWLTAERDVLAARRGKRSTSGRNASTNGPSHARGKTRRAA